MAETQYRFTVAYLLLIQLGITCYFRWRAPWRLFTAVTFVGCFLAPVVLFVAAPQLVLFAQFTALDGFRVQAFVPATAAILLLFWSYRTQLQHAAVAAGQPSLCRSGPYRLTRHPVEAAHSLFFFSAAILSSNWLILCWVLIGVLFLQPQLVWEERRLRAQFGHAFDSYAAQTGRLFVKLGRLKTRRYTVPRRFGLSAVMALITSFGLLFGVLNYANAPPVVYLFAGFEIVAICLVQILFGRAPRGASAATGALLLPICVLLTTARPTWMSLELYLACLTFLVLFGGLLGYCLGALAAGFFLVMDLIEPYLPGGPPLQLDAEFRGESSVQSPKSRAP